QKQGAAIAESERQNALLACASNRASLRIWAIQLELERNYLGRAMDTFKRALDNRETRHGANHILIGPNSRKRGQNNWIIAKALLQRLHSLQAKIYPHLDPDQNTDLERLSLQSNYDSLAEYYRSYLVKTDRCHLPGFKRVPYSTHPCVNSMSL